MGSPICLLTQFMKISPLVPNVILISLMSSVYFDIVMQKNNAVRFSEVTFDIRYLCAGLSHLRAQHETETAFVGE